MKKPALWLALAVLALVIGAAYKFRRRAEPPSAMKPAAAKPLPSASPFSPPPNQAAPPKPQPIVAIQDGKTIDFSSGAPIVKDNAQEKAIIEKSLKDMEAALREVSFGPQEPAKKTSGK